MLERGEWGFVTAFTVLHPALLSGVEFVPWGVGIDADGFAVAKQVSLAILAAFTLEGFDRTVANGEQMVGDGLVEIDANDAPEAPAIFASAQR